MNKTSIQWTDLSVNPIRARHKATGKVGWHCVMISPGCVHCYSHTLADPKGGDPDEWPEDLRVREFPR